MSFANPYNFVGIDEGNVQRETNWRSHEKLGEFNGMLTCEITFLSNFITENTDREKKPLTINGKLGIQASSLKGMLRSTAEAISNSCISMMSGRYRYRFMSGMPVGKSSSSGIEYKRVFEQGRDWLEFNQKSLVREEAFIDSCDDKKGLCICCRLFGTTAKEDPTTEKSFSYKGRIRLSDALFLGICEKNGNINKNINPVVVKYLHRHLSNPKNHHEAFYLDGNKIKGRKFYYHHNDDKLQDSGQIKVDLVKKEAVFKFTISFENLTKEEYALLLTTLELQPGLGHKIGMGKPLGLGSCVIEVTEIKEFRQERYLSINKCAEKVFKNDELNRRKDEIKKWRTSEIPQDLRCILKISPGFTEIRYPIKDIRNSHRDEFSRYKKLHPPCREFSPDDKGSGRTITYSEQKKSERPGKSRPEGLGSMAEALKKAKKK